MRPSLHSWRFCESLSSEAARGMGRKKLLKFSSSVHKTTSYAGLVKPYMYLVDGKTAAIATFTGWSPAGLNLCRENKCNTITVLSLNRALNCITITSNGDQVWVCLVTLVWNPI